MDQWLRGSIVNRLVLAFDAMDDITLVGVDTGGTFTDIVVLERVLNTSVMRHCKVLSDPSDPSSPIVEGLKAPGFGKPEIKDNSWHHCWHERGVGG